MSSEFFNNDTGHTLFDKLKGIAINMANFDRFLAVVGFFRSSGYFKLRKELNDVEEIKILVGINIDDIFRRHNKALLFISKDAAMTKADVQYLEHRAIAEAKISNTFVLNENKQTPKAPNLPEYRKDDMEGFFEDVKFLTSFIGCNIFDVAKPKEEHLFYTKGRGCNAKGFYDANGFTVLKGSTIAKSSVPSFTWKDKREKLLSEYTSANGDKLELESDKTFSSPSTAADFCIGSSNNGWLVWKDKDGQTLDSAYRKQLE